MSEAAQRRARIAWAALIEASDEEVHQHIDRLGHQGALEALIAGALPVRESLRARALALDIDRIEANSALIGAHILTPQDPRWPSRLRAVPREPHALWVRGNADLEALCQRSVAIVGARMATAYGVDRTCSMSAGLALRDFTVVSGGAYGIDKAAHDGALSVHGASVLVSAAGVDLPYPAVHARLFERIVATGAVVSESPPGSSPLRVRFLNRNRIIAAMTRGTLVVEAGRRSGSLNTARTAGALGRVVCAVPGPVTSRVSVGCHDLIRDAGAVLVTDVDEVADAIGDFGRDTAPRAHEAHVDEKWSLSDRAVYSAVGVRRPVSVDQVLAATDLPLPVVHEALIRLEGDGVIRCIGGDWQKAPLTRDGASSAVPSG